MDTKSDYEIRTLKIGVLMKGKSIWDESATEIEIIDEGTGEFLKVTQSLDDNDSSIRIDIYEWDTLKGAIEEMIGECRKDEND